MRTKNVIMKDDRLALILKLRRPLAKADQIHRTGKECRRKGNRERLQKLVKTQAFNEL